MGLNVRPLVFCLRMSLGWNYLSLPPQNKTNKQTYTATKILNIHCKRNQVSVQQQAQRRYSLVSSMSRGWFLEDKDASILETSERLWCWRRLTNSTSGSFNKWCRHLCLELLTVTVFFMDAFTAVFHSSDLFPHWQSHRTLPAVNLLLAAADPPDLGRTPSAVLCGSRGALHSSGLSHIWQQFMTWIDEAPSRLLAARLLRGCCAKVVFRQRERQRVSRADGGLSQHEAAVSEHLPGAVPKL